MDTLYITDQGAMLKKRSNRIAVKKDGKIIDEVPILELKRVLVFGNNQISTDLMRHLAGKGIEIAFLSVNGRFQFRVVPDTSKNIYLRMAQHRRYLSNAFRVAWGKTVVGGKLRNQRNLLVHSQKNASKANLQKEIDALKELSTTLKLKTTLDGIMGVEGYGSKVYFEGFAKLILGDFTFEKREYYPPPDPVNALLSFGYMLIFNEISGMLHALGFDCFLGFLHSAAYGRESLVSDLMEELRSPVVDRLVLYLINLGVVHTGQFTSSKKGSRMDDRARKAFLKNYEKFMTASFSDYRSGEKTTFRKIIKENAFRLERLLLNNEEYTPFLYRP